MYDVINSYQIYRCKESLLRHNDINSILHTQCNLKIKRWVRFVRVARTLSASSVIGNSAEAASIEAAFKLQLNVRVINS